MTMFLFQTGAIKSEIIVGENQGCRWFLFQTGAIKRQSGISVLDKFTNVSIPNWCD